MANQKSIYTSKSIYTAEMRLLTARIKEMRLAAGMTQLELAQKLGKVSHTAVLKLEQGQVRVELLELRRICVICNVPFREFIDRVADDLERLEKQVSE